MKQFILNFLLAYNIAHGSPSVTLESGTVIIGTADPLGKDVNAFLGIPFAVPPVGDLRFKSPVPYNFTEEEVIDASKAGDVCWQVGDKLDAVMSEDCLTLNVWVNKKSAMDGLVPVGLYVHGGAYVQGAGSWYDGSKMVEYWDGAAIMVTINYRLNAFGFLGSDELKSFNADESTGNAGVQDQRLAMQWVKDNIAAFGGDPNRVTIFGESAGGGSMSNHLTMKRSFDLYDQVIIESGSFSQWVTQPMWVTQVIYDQVLKKTACKNAQCLVDLDAKDLLDAVADMTHYTTYSYIGFAPTADGVEIESHPWEILKNGGAKDVPILHGTNRDEGFSFTPLDQNCTEGELREMWSEQFDEEQVESLIKIYVIDNEGSYPEVDGTSLYFWAGERSYGDFSFSCPAKFLSTNVDGNGKDLYMYHFRYKKSEENFVTHASEIQYVFHAVAGGENNENIADFMSTSWKNFIETGSPNANNEGDWVKWDKESDRLLVIDVSNTVESRLKQEECDFLVDVLDHRIAADFRNGELPL